MRTLPVLLLLTSVVATAAWAAPVEPDQYTEIVLGARGTSVSLDVRTRQEGYLLPVALFAPPELGLLHYALNAKDGTAVDLKGPMALPAGLYRLTVSADGASPRAFNLTVRQVTWRDSFEPNDSAKTARKVALPFAAGIALRDARDQDWFSFEAPGPGVLLVRLSSSSGNPGLLVEANAQNDPALHEGQQPVAGDGAPATEQFGSSFGLSHRYFEVKTRGTWLVRAQLAADPSTEDNEFPAHIDILFYPDKAGGGGGPSLVALGVSPDDPNIQQIRLRLRAEGKNVLVTNNPAEIAQALVNVATPPPSIPTWRMGLYALLGLLVVGGGLFAAWWRLRGRAKVTLN